MLIANGFITETPSQAYLQVCDRCDGHEVRTTPLPISASAKHWWDITSCWKGTSIGSNPILFVLHPLHGKDELYR